MRAIVTILLTLLAACSAAPAPAVSPVAAQVDATYALVQINGLPLPTPSPAEESVTVQAVTLVLRADSSYTLTGKAVHDDGTSIVGDVGGTYRTEEGILVLVPEDDEEGDATAYRGTFADGTLRLVDDLDDEYVFTRQ